MEIREKGERTWLWLGNVLIFLRLRARGCILASFSFSLIVLFSLATRFSLFYLGLLVKIDLLVSNVSTILLFSDKTVGGANFTTNLNKFQVQPLVLIKIF